MNRSLLLITPFFAPQNHAAVFRAYKLAKYLPRYGWNPIVLTVDRQYEYNEDPELIRSLPPEVEIVKVRYIEPTLRGLRMAVGGRDRGFQARKAAGALRSAGRAASGPALEAWPARAYQYLLSHYAQVPDAFWTWAQAATAAGHKLLRERQIHLVYTTAPPYSCLEIGQALQQTGAKWVADFRDPIAYYRRLSSPVPRVYNQQRRIVARALESANALTWAASCFGSIYSDVFGKCVPDATFIPTGIDPALLDTPDLETPSLETPSQETPDRTGHPRPYLIFTGEFLPNYAPDFFESLAAALGRVDLQRTGIRLLVVGTLELNRRRMLPLIERFGLEEHVEFRDQVPQREVYRLVSQARAGVLLPGSQARWWTNAAKMTDFIGMRKPVVAVVADPSEARSELTKTGLGVFLDGSVEDRARRLAEFILGEHRLPPPHPSHCDRYTVGSQVRSFADVFDRVARAAAPNLRPC
jgi:glycosyltransferase involved in cell wall biosynthesis